MPQDVAQLKSYLELLSYYSKFLPNLSTVVALLNKLQHRSQPWQWTEKEEAAFTASKQLIALSQVLIHFDPNLEVILSCDASAYGIGLCCRIAFLMEVRGQWLLHLVPCHLQRPGILRLRRRD